MILNLKSDFYSQKLTYQPAVYVLIEWHRFCRNPNFGQMLMNIPIERRKNIFIRNKHRFSQWWLDRWLKRKRKINANKIACQCCYVPQSYFTILLKLFASVSTSFAFLNISTEIYAFDFYFYSIFIPCFCRYSFSTHLLIGLNRFSTVATNLNYIIWIVTENHRENDLFITKPILDMGSILMTLEYQTIHF